MLAKKFISTTNFYYGSLGNASVSDIDAMHPYIGSLESSGTCVDLGQEYYMWIRREGWKEAEIKEGRWIQWWWVAKYLTFL